MRGGSVSSNEANPGSLWGDFHAQVAGAAEDRSGAVAILSGGTGHAARRVSGLRDFLVNDPVELLEGVEVIVSVAADSAILAYAVAEGGPNYLLHKSHDWVLLMKQSGMSFAALCGARVTTPDTGIVLSLALTGAGQNVILTARVSDKAAPGTLRAELSFVDTPAADAVLNVQQIGDITGLNLPEFGSDPGAPYRNGHQPWLGLWQHTDGTKPAAQAIFDNFERATYEMPKLGIQRGVRLTWPTTGINYAIGTAPTVQGPWLPVQSPVIPGIETLNLPANDNMQFFRSRQAP